MAIKERWKGTRPVPLTTDEAVESVVSLFSANQLILAGYLFGSRVTGDGSPDSDIDIAFHASRDFTWEDYFILWRDLSKTFHSERFDLLWLDKSSPDIAFDVIKYGMGIYNRNDDLLNDFELYAKKRYWDYKIYLREKTEPKEHGGI